MRGMFREQNGVKAELQKALVTVVSAEPEGFDVCK